MLQPVLSFSSTEGQVFGILGEQKGLTTTTLAKLNSIGSAAGNSTCCPTSGGELILQWCHDSLAPQQSALMALVLASMATVEQRIYCFVEWPLAQWQPADASASDK